MGIKEFASIWGSYETELIAALRGSDGFVMYTEGDSPMYQAASLEAAVKDKMQEKVLPALLSGKPYPSPSELSQEYLDSL